MKEESTPMIPVATHSFNQKYLYAFAGQAEIVNHIRTQALEEEAKRLPDILAAWEKQRRRVADLMNVEIGVPEQIRIQEIPKECNSRISNIGNDELFKKTFGNYPISFRMVEIDKLVAAQRTVNLDYVDRLKKNYPNKPHLEQLIEICISPNRSMDPIQHLEVAPNTHVFSSPNSDIRFLGAFVKHLTKEDMEYAVHGGLPAAAVITFVGYGGAPINVLQAGSRVVLNNGFHRVFALRSLGIESIPVVIQHVTNVQLEFPPQVAGLPKEYLLGVPRPVLMKDFFEPEFSITLKVRERIKMVTVGIGVNQHEIPS